MGCVRTVIEYGCEVWLNGVVVVVNLFLFLLTILNVLIIYLSILNVRNNMDYTVTYFLPTPSTERRTRVRSELLNVSLVSPRVEFYTALPVSSGSMVM